jgi:tRNA(fMet)-specific endonuclease VapC
LKYLLDTDTVSYFLRDQRGVASRLLSKPPDDLALSRVTVAELWVLARTAKQGRVNPSTLGKVVRAFRCLPVSEVVWDHFASAKAVLARTGRTLGPTGNFDVLIGCTASLHRMTVVTNNEKHFRPLSDVLGFSIENWADPEATR